MYLARKRKTGDVYAIKMLKKDDMVRKNMVEHVMAERDIMAGNNNSFVVKLYYAFQSEVLTLNTQSLPRVYSSRACVCVTEIPVSGDGVLERW